MTASKENVGLTFLILGCIKSWAKTSFNWRAKDRKSCPACASLKVLHTDKQNQPATCMSSEGNSIWVLRAAADFCCSRNLPHQHLAYNIAQDFVPRLHLLRDLIFGIKEHFAILNKAEEDSKGEASKKIWQLVPFFPVWAIGIFLHCWRTFICSCPGGTHAVQVKWNEEETCFTQTPYSLRWGNEFIQKGWDDF